jgi:hypothetical protein
MGGPRQQCRAAVTLTSGAHRAAGEGEERGADRRDRPVSGRGQRGGCGLRGAHVGRPEKEKGGPSPDE